MGSQVDVGRARQAKDRAEEQMRQGDDDEAKAALRRAEVRLTASGAA